MRPIFLNYLYNVNKKYNILTTVVINTGTELRFKQQHATHDRAVDTRRTCGAVTWLERKLLTSTLRQSSPILTTHLQ